MITLRRLSEALFGAPHFLTVAAAIRARPDREFNLSDIGQSGSAGQSAIKRLVHDGLVERQDPPSKHYRCTQHSHWQTLEAIELALRAHNSGREWQPRVGVSDLLFWQELDRHIDIWGGRLFGNPVRFRALLWLGGRPIDWFLPSSYAEETFSRTELTLAHLARFQELGMIQPSRDDHDNRWVRINSPLWQIGAVAASAIAELAEDEQGLPRLNADLPDLELPSIESVLTERIMAPAHSSDGLVHLSISMHEVVSTFELAHGIVYRRDPEVYVGLSERAICHSEVNQSCDNLLELVTCAACLKSLRSWTRRGKHERHHTTQQRWQAVELARQAIIQAVGTGPGLAPAELDTEKNEAVRIRGEWRIISHDRKHAAIKRLTSQTYQLAFWDPRWNVYETSSWSTVRSAVGHFFGRPGFFDMGYKWPFTE
jgi:hypothetical protein